MKQRTWKDRAHSVIQEVYLTWTDVNGFLPSPQMCESDKQRLWLMVKKSYPFGERAMHPYKVWLNELKKVKAWLWPKTPAPIQDGLFAEDV